MEGASRSCMWNRIEKLESAIDDGPKIAQAGREITKFFSKLDIVYRKLAHKSVNTEIVHR